MFYWGKEEKGGWGGKAVFFGWEEKAALEERDGEENVPRGRGEHLNLITSHTYHIERADTVLPLQIAKFTYILINFLLPPKPPPPKKKKRKEKGGFFYLRVHPDIEVNITWHLKNIPRHDEVDVFSTSCSYSDNGAFTECELSSCPLRLKILLRGDTFHESQPDYRDDGVVFENQRGVNDKDILEKKSQLQQIMMEHLGCVLKQYLPQVGLILQINLAWTTDNLLVGRPRPARVTEEVHLRLQIHTNCSSLHWVSLVWHSKVAELVFWGDPNNGAVQNWL